MKNAALSALLMLAGDSDGSLLRSIEQSCPECIRKGAKNVRVFKTHDGLVNHLQRYHGIEPRER